MHYLITGGAGFIGSHLIEAILRTDSSTQVTCIDNFDAFYDVRIKRNQIEPFKKFAGFRLLEIDLATHAASELMELVTEPVDYIIHLAAKAGVRPSIQDPEGYLLSNVLGLQHLLDFARYRPVRSFIFASSSSVYGINPALPWQEDEKLLPISPYAMTKLAGEMMGHVYQKLYGMRFIALRFFTVYGPGQRPDLAIHHFTKNILNGQPIKLFGDGSSSRDYTFVEDIVDGIISAIQYEKTDFEIINLGNSERVSLREMLGTIEEVTGKKAIIENYPEQPGDVPHTYADISKARRLLNYQPTTGFKKGVERFYEWYIHSRKNAD